MRIVVTRRVPEAALVELRALGEVWVSPEDRPLTPDELRKAVEGASAVVSMLHDRIDASVAEAAGPGLRVVANVAVGYDNIDVPALAERGIAVTNTPDVLTDATADLAFGLLLALTRRIAEGDRLLRARKPWSFHLGFMLGSGLQAKTLGIIGPGKIGHAMAKRAEAFGMHVVYSGRNDPVEDLLRVADVVSLHCPLTPGTRHLIDAAALKLMKPSAVLINTTRGPVVDEAALADALLSRRIAGAGLDVFEHEPDVEPRLLELDNVVLTPHLGSATVETRTEMALLAADNVTAVLTGAEPLNPVHH
ncbi:D-glycerate dehydrogenase [Amycolatopsis acidiphila]|uniref:D-glycerate dehydrogenase n=1 Tax=Amycolatopsis acidiphila TaxID=715473 RepID=A0A558AH96_9PSEU|nr:D-glycerate dehydrogenase [Amycolatopsis acidiphila]TVT23616.1 D-glycerate dehydrogenase [Amycolatopsis acidiphila]UIJ58602.1 D-glycerate dehydrogenase [Amycolatopsis acidiphila]GHG76542.1 D-glycerate dehydrogenase [Amycolatopsis acidiphila]